MNHVFGGGSVPLTGRGTLEVILGYVQTCPRSIFSTLFAKGQRAVDVVDIHVHVINVICNVAARFRTRSINSTLFDRWQQRCGLSLSVL